MLKYTYVCFAQINLFLLHKFLHAFAILQFMASRKNLNFTKIVKLKYLQQISELCNDTNMHVLFYCKKKKCYKHEIAGPHNIKVIFILVHYFVTRSASCAEPFGKYHLNVSFGILHLCITHEVAK